MEPLIITSNDPMIPPGPNQIAETIDAAVAAAEAGATILHHHLIYNPPNIRGGEPVLDVDASIAIIEGIRKRSNAIIQLGITSATNESRMAVAKGANVDMFSMTICDNDHYFDNFPFPSVHRDRTEMVMLADFCLDNNIRPEFEVFHTGAVWNLHYLIKEGKVRPPYWINLCMYTEGSCWSPRTEREVDYRSSLLPEGSKWHLVAFTHANGAPTYVFPPPTPERHTQLMAHAILMGGHVRMGREDRPEIATGRPAKSNAELIAMIKQIAESLGRPVATPAEARRMLDIAQK